MTIADRVWGWLYEPKDISFNKQQAPRLSKARI